MEMRITPRFLVWVQDRVCRFYPLKGGYNGWSSASSSRFLYSFCLHISWLMLCFIYVVICTLQTNAFLYTLFLLRSWQFSFAKTYINYDVRICMTNCFMSDMFMWCLMSTWISTRDFRKFYKMREVNSNLGIYKSYVGWTKWGYCWGYVVFV